MTAMIFQFDRRMAKAKESLASSAAAEVPVSEVAHALGFKSTAHFDRACSAS